MNKRLLIPLLLAVSIAAIVIWLLFHTSRKEDGGKIRVSGNIEVTTVELSFKVPGRVKERLVDEGDQVRQG